jgi:hypothetical protein
MASRPHRTCTGGVADGVPIGYRLVPGSFRVGPLSFDAEAGPGAPGFRIEEADAGRPYQPTPDVLGHTDLVMFDDTHDVFMAVGLLAIAGVAGYLWVTRHQPLTSRQAPISGVRKAPGR